ncbi:MAG: hypothetical protein R2860_09635 [Desulfobacterales bacterium]
MKTGFCGSPAGSGTVQAAKRQIRIPGAVERRHPTAAQYRKRHAGREGKKYNVCIVIPDFEVLGKYAEANGLPTDPDALQVANQQVTDMLADEITQFLKQKYGGYEIPKKFLFIADDFTLENGMLTQTMKLKRRVVFEKYNDAIEALYQ